MNNEPGLSTEIVHSDREFGVEHDLMQIRLDDLSGPEIRALLDEHLRNMAQLSPPGSVHALDIEALRMPEVTFWTAWSDDKLLGCGALKKLSPGHGEVKSMRTASAHHRKGVARAILSQIQARKLPCPNERAL